MSTMEDQMYMSSREPKHGPYTVVSTRPDGGSSSSQQGKHASTFRRARRPMTPAAVSEGLLDWTVAISSLYFVVFAALVYVHRGEPADSEWGRALLRAAQYGPTILPIVFSAIVARFLLVLAHAKLEAGSRVLTLEHLLHSRTVFSTFTASINLRSFHIITPLLILLWSLSPLGGQASLRIIGVEPHTNVTALDFKYLAYASTFSNTGAGTASSQLIVPINAGFTGAIGSSVNSKQAHQDPYGNIKVPIFDLLEPSTGPNASEWRDIPATGNTTWSSLTGIPVLGMPADANSTFRLNTGYMTTDCQVTGSNETRLFRDMGQSNYTIGGGWSGANFAMSGMIVTYYGAPAANFIFRSVASMGTSNETRPLTTANCTAYMHYVEQDVRCEGRSCRSLRARPAPVPAAHISPIWDNAIVKANLTEYTPLNGLAQNDSMVLQFFKNFINSTNPSLACDTSYCPMSGIEGYLVSPDSPFGVDGTPLIWALGDEIVSRRMTQLINTFWMNSIAPFSMAGNFTALPDGIAQRYNVDNVGGTREETTVVLKVNIAWMAILLISSAVMFICGMWTVVMSMRRRGPDILDNFTGLLRDNPHVHDPSYSSMDDAYDQAKRLRNTVVRLGDVRPDAEVGHVAIASSADVLVGPLSVKKLYD